MENEKNSTLFIVDSDNFTGGIYSYMTDGKHSDFTGETLEEMRQRNNNPNLQLVPLEEINRMTLEYHSKLQGPFEEIAEDYYYYYLGAVLPKRNKGGRFFSSEAYYGCVHRFCFRTDDRFFTALRDIRLSDDELSKQIADFLKAKSLIK